ncbi:IS110 family transposase [Chamaesiphon minutus]|uniref:Transposase n=1 Tax=Chamaesiphon minutus (strain ATCC 27169 / PCC 6605) TaxID=1173020 RepID=K9UDI5_CHAP6|nr:IS110 family transposase [Chamaesiphon minutus]AFY92486.1 Transposase [Chamaesiphon minutus PCC 6605]
MVKPKVEPELKRVHPQAAGIDIGASEHWVSIPSELDPEPVRKFSCFTADLYAIAQWLKSRGITTVVMESTGVYWIPLFQILETSGLEVRLVNAHFVKTVPGRKSDVLDCQWLQKLHSYGLLSGSFRPDDQICVFRSYIRQRDSLTKSASVHIQRMQKALTQMNVQLHRVVSDITGVTGMAIIRAIVAGERDPQQLAALKDPRAKRSTAEIAAALVGDYRVEHLFVLKQELNVNRAANAFRIAAQSLANSRTALGGFYRRIRSRSGAPIAITATAHKLARIFYHLWTTGEDFVAAGVDAYEQQYQQRIVKHLKQRAKQMGFDLVPEPTVN